MNPCLIRAGTSLLGAALVFAGCEPGVVDPQSADPRLQTSIVPHTSWPRVERATFFYSVPPGFVDLDLQPIDPGAVTFALGDSSLHHDSVGIPLPANA